MRKAFLAWGVGTALLACLAFVYAPNAHAVTLITNGSSQIGSFPVAESDLPETGWRIDTSSVDSATVTSTAPNFAGPSYATLADPTGWTRLINESYDDSYVQVPFGFSINFNGTSYTSTFVGSNSYVTFGTGASDYSDLSASVPPYPADHICSDDNSYQRVYYKLDDADTLRVRYEGEASTSGTVGNPGIVIEYVFYRNQSYHDVFIGRHDRCGSYPALTVSKLGEGLVGDYSLPATLPGSPENDRGDLYAAQLVFSAELATSSRGAVEGNITAIASGDTPRYEWSGSTLNIYSSSTVTWPEDVMLQVTSAAGYTAYNMLLIDADDEPPTVTTLGDGSADYELPSTCPSVACDRGDIYGAALVFSENLSSDSKTAVESAITAGASAAPRTYVWNANRVRIYATEPVTFAEDVYADLTDEYGNTAAHQKLIDSVPPAPTQVWVDDDYSSGNSGGHEWNYDAFDNIGDALSAIAEGGTVHVLAGYYEGSTYTINKNGVTLDGPSSGDPAYVVASCDAPLTINGASHVTVSHLKLYQTDGGAWDGSWCYSTPVVRVGWTSASTTLSNNEIAGGYTGVALRFDSYDNVLTGNDIHDNDWAGVVDLGIGAETYTDNTFNNNGYGISFGYGPDRSEQQALVGTEVSGNTFTNNSRAAIYYYSGDQGGSFTIGPDNDIHDNSDGIYVEGNAYNVHINGNKIYNNVAITSGLHVVDASTGLDATENWWGDASGPYQEIYNASGTGDTVYIGGSSQFVNFRPFCVDENCDDLSQLEIDPSNIAALFENGGSIVPILTSPDDADPTTVLVDSLNVNEDITISVPTPGGTSSVTLPAGTVITKTDGGTFDANDMTAAEVTLSSLSGFGANTVVEGALQWGVPNLGLTFSQPITISIFVGTDMNGRTLSVVRSTSMTSGWTSDGIVSPATCLVASGICSFQTTKASYFSSNSQSSSSGSGGGGGSYYVEPKAVGTGASQVTVAMGQTGDIGTVNTDGVNFLTYVNSKGKFKALVSKTMTVNEYTLNITALDLGLNKSVEFSIDGLAKQFKLGLAETAKIDLDADGTDDVSVMFSGVWVNRAELTIKSLLTQGTTTVAPTKVSDTISIGALKVKFKFTRDLRLNMVGADVMELQKFLNAKGFIVAKTGPGSKGKETTKFGPATRNALIKFQKANKIKPASGLFGPLTRKLVNDMK